MAKTIARPILPPPMYDPAPAVPSVATKPTPDFLKGEVVLQIYRGGISGPDKRGTLRGYLDRMVRTGLRAVCFHGFPDELLAAWPGLRDEAEGRGLRAMASWGVDLTSETPQHMGTAIGTLLADPRCAGGLVDAEGRWDAGGSDPLGLSEAGALALGEALRAKAPDALVADQCWFAIDSHGQVRRTPQPMAKGGTFAGFPVDEFGRNTVNWMRARQAYCNEAGFKAQWGGSRWERISGWMEKDWNTIQPALVAAGAERPLGVTLQAYGWDTNYGDAIDAMLTYGIRRGLPVIAWCDPFPEPGFLLAMSGYKKLIATGHALQGRTSREAVMAYQSDYNRTAARKLDVDGDCGTATLASMGLHL